MSELQIIFLEVSVLGLACVAAIWLVRQLLQRRADKMRKTYSLTFPAGMEQAQVLDFVRSVMSQLPRPKILQPAYAVAFETYADHAGKHHYLHVPGHVSIKVDKLLNKKIAGIGIEQLKDADDLVLTRQWQTAIEIGMSGDKKFRIMEPAHLAASIDVNFDSLDQDEALVLQWVVIPDRARRPTPEDKTKVEDHTMHAVARIGAVGNKSAQLVADLAGVLASVNSHDSRFYKRWMFGVPERINRRAGTLGYPIFLNAPEFTALMGWPLDGQGGSRSRQLPVSSMVPETGLHLAGSNFASSRGRAISIPFSCLPQHQWWIGPTGSGKSTQLHNQAFQFAAMGMGFALIEPKGDLNRDVLESIPESRVNDVIYFDPTDEANPIGFNILAGSDPHRTASHVLALFKSKYSASWGPQLEMCLRVALYTAAEHGLTILEVKELLRNPDFRKPYVRTLKDKVIKRDWQSIDAKPDIVTSSINKIDSFTNSPLMRNIVGQIGGGINMRDVVLGKKILLASLNGILIGENEAAILGQMLIDQLWAAARSIPEDRRSIFPVIADEFQKFIGLTDSIEDIFAMARSYKMPIIAAHQYTSQLSAGVLAALRNNARTKGAFSVSPDDAKAMAAFFPPMTAENLQALGLHGVVISIMTDQGLAPAVTGITYEPPKPTGFGQAALDHSRAEYSVARAKVEADIDNRYRSAQTERRRPVIGKVGRVEDNDANNN